MKRKLSMLTLNKQAVTHAVQEYFVNIFSVIARQTLLDYQLLMKTTLFGDNGTETCIEIAPKAGLQYDATRYVITSKASCKPPDSHRSI